jgi:hypothetical protein
MKETFAVAMIAITLGVGPAHAQNMPAPKPEDAEKNAFQTPTAGKQGPTNPPAKNDPGVRSSGNPEGRMNDNPPAHEKPGAGK